MVLGESLGLAAVGIIIGIPAAVVLLRISAANLFGTSPSDPFAIAFATLLLSAVASCGCLIPARRAVADDV